jgi:hypothetical protein
MQHMGFKAEAARSSFNGFELAFVSDWIPEHRDAAQPRSPDPECLHASSPRCSSRLFLPEKSMLDRRRTNQGMSLKISFEKELSTFDV